MSAILNAENATIIPVLPRASESDPPMLEGQQPVDGLGEILKWSAQAPAWQQDALRRLCAGPDIEATDEAELLTILKGEKAAEPLSDQHISQTAKASRPVTLKSVRNVENVNALAPNQMMSFSERGMTIVYGDNGSGKSGYVRILKAACRARLDRSFNILPNIYDASKSGAPTAQLIYFDGLTKQSTQWVKGTASPPVLSAISVFDTAAGNIHATGTNDIAYTPFPLLVLARLARVADSLRVKLTAEIKLLEGQTPPTVLKHECSSHTATGKLLGSLSGKTKLADVASLCAFSSEEKAELVSLRKDLADDPAAIATRCLKLAQRLEGFDAVLASVTGALDDNAVSRVLTLKREIASTTEAARADADRRFASDPLPVGLPAWETLWEAARSYAEEHVHPGQEFPQIEEGGVCVLCQRPYDEDTADRFKRFHAFVADELGKQIKAAQAALGVALTFQGDEYLKARKIAEIRDFLVQVGESDLAQKISAFLVKAAWRCRWIKRASTGASPDTAPLLAPAPSADIAALTHALREKARIMQGAVTSPERKALKERLDELADREWLGVVKDDVLKAIDLKKQIAALEALVPQTVRAKITTKSTALAKELVTDRLRDRFASEVADLGISRLRVELRQEKSEAGQARFKVCFVAKPTENVGAVLSEGELRCLAIAAFLAELETAEGSSGIVLDDPICSLDHMHREKVAQRLAREALRRQVIVFTHDVPFLSQLQQACREAGARVLMRLVSRGATPGFCHEDAPPTHRPIKDAIATVTADIKNKRYLYDTGDPRWVDCVTSFGGTLRKLWERAVEDVLSTVLTRWTHKVDTSGFIGLTILTEADHKSMRQAYGLCSVWEHYQPAAGNAPQPSFDDIAAEALRLTTWLDNIKARQKALI